MRISESYSYFYFNIVYLMLEIINTLIKNALNAIPEPEFAVSLLMTARHINYIILYIVNLFRFRGYIQLVPLILLARYITQNY